MRMRLDDLWKDPLDVGPSGPAKTTRARPKHPHKNDGEEREVGAQHRRRAHGEPHRRQQLADLLQEEE